MSKLDEIRARANARWREEQPPERKPKLGELCGVHRKSTTVSRTGTNQVADHYCPVCRESHEALRAVYAQTNGEQAARDVAYLYRLLDISDRVVGLLVEDVEGEYGERERSALDGQRYLRLLKR